MRTSTFVRGHKAPAATGTPEPLVATQTLVQSVTLWAIKSTRAANTGNIYVDSATTNDAQLGELTAGSKVTLTAGPGYVIDLSQIYVDSLNVGDGVFFLGLR